MKEKEYSGRMPGELFIKGFLVIALLTVFGCAGPESRTPTQLTLIPDYQSNGDSLPEIHIPDRNTKGDSQRALLPSDWLPIKGQESKGRWEGILIHHSGSYAGNAREFDRWHRQLDWDGLGYHFVVDNGHGGPDGRVEVGYRWQQQLTGAHCREAQGDDNYWNEHTIGICLVGNFEQHPPTATQYESLVELIQFLQARYGIPTNKIIGHNDVKPTACPGRLFSWDELSRRLSR